MLGAPAGRTRTGRQRLRKRSLCPPELRGLAETETVFPRRIAWFVIAGPAIAPSAARTPARAGTRVCLVPGTGQPLDQLWHPDMPAATGYAHTRTGDIASAVRTDDRFYGYRPNQ